MILIAVYVAMNIHTLNILNFQNTKILKLKEDSQIESSKINAEKGGHRHRIWLYIEVGNCPENHILIFNVDDIYI